ncbi:MAG: enoyl-CoA hydratase/isomerase family protein [Pseudomonadales bacterium]
MTSATEIEPAVVIERHDGWAEVILNRPERRNAITGPLGTALDAALTALSGDPEVRAVLLRGAGGAFCSGLDLKAFNADPVPDWLAEFPRIWRGAHRALFRCDKPIVGALERYAINGGAALALACDLLVSGDSDFLQVGEVTLGMAAPYNLAWLSLRHSEAVNARVALIGERLAGPELVRLGIAQSSVADDTVVEAARSLCATLAGHPAGAAARIKSTLRARLGQDADAWFDRFVGDGAGAARPPMLSERS